MEYKQEKRICQNCKKDFTVEPDDFNFYEKMKVKPPEFCYQCGISRVEVLRNERVVYWGECAKCAKKTMSLYHPNSLYKVYCHDCWFSDGWDGLDYGIDYDPNSPIIEQVVKLQKTVPRESVIILNSTNCAYGNNVRDSKNCYFSFLVSNSENVLYSMWIVSKDCMDCHKITGSELTLYSVNVTNSYHCAYIQDSSDCSDCYFSYDLRGCTNCLFCYNLRNKSYCVRNKEFGKEEYLREYEKVFNGSYTTLLKSIAEYEELKKSAIHRFAFFLKSSGCVGNYLENCNRNFWCFDGVDNQDVRNVASILHSKNAEWSYAIGTQPTENIFGSAVIKGGSMVKNSFNLFNSSFCDWCDSLISCNNCIACVGLKKKEYCILNKQYSKEEYIRLKKYIEEKGDLSMFMTPRFSTFGYNETAAYDYYPLSKEEISKQGYSWQDDFPATSGQETIQLKDMPDNIENVSNDILKEVFACVKCQRNYRITLEELQYLRLFILPLPRECPQCRMAARRKMRLPFKLWHRDCMCDKKGHFHGEKHCEIEFETAYAPDRPEIIYCERCYQQEIY